MKVLRYAILVHESFGDLRIIQGLHLEYAASFSRNKKREIRSSLVHYGPNKLEGHKALHRQGPLKFI